MTPNQARAIPDALARLLDSGERQGLTPETRFAEAEHALADGRVYVFTHWTEPEGEGVTLSVYIEPDGETVPRDAAWKIRHGTYSLDPLDRPGVRIGEDGQAVYSAGWLDA